MALTAERISSQRGRLTLLNTLAAACFSYVAISNAYDNPARTPAYAILWLLWLAVTMVWVFGVPGWRGFSKRQRSQINDELVKAHQATSARLGLGCAIAAMGGVSVIEFYGALPLWVLPTATTLVVVITALCFAWLEMRDE